MDKIKTINDFLEHLETDKFEQVQALRRIILDTEPKLIEHIKWNAPSYVYEGEDRLTFNLMNKQRVVMLVFHMGALRPEDKNAKPIMLDHSGLITWNSDIRGTISFSDITDIELKADALKTIITKWLSIT